MSDVPSVDFTLAIVAGGQSSRMGTNKAFVQIGNQSIIANMLERTQYLGQRKTILITNTPAEYQYLKLPMYPDVIPNKGALGGIYSAIQHSDTPYTLVLACDMPFVNPDVLRYLLMQCQPDVEVVVPYVNERWQGLHTVYHKDCASTLKMAIKADKLKVQSVLGELKAQVIDETALKAIDHDLRSFFNVNTPADLKLAHTIWDTLN